MNTAYTGLAALFAVNEHAASLHGINSTATTTVLDLYDQVSLHLDSDGAKITYLAQIFQ